MNATDPVEIERQIVNEMIERIGFEKANQALRQKYHDFNGCPAKPRTYCRGCQRWKQ